MTLNFTLLQIDTSNFWVVNWYYVAAILIALTGLFFAIKNYLKKSHGMGTHVNNPNTSTNSNTNANNLTVNIGKDGSEAQAKSQTAPTLSEDFDRLKKLTHILFIDDDVKFKIVKIILNTGWVNTKSITDLDNYDDELLKKSHIVFVDVQGVGKLLDCKDEGLSLALHIKNKYPQKKVVIYSAIQAHKVFHEAIQKVDFLLSKDAEPFEFISLIERFSKEIGL